MNRLILLLGLIALFFLVGVHEAQAQVTVRGKIKEANSNKVLYPATVRNVNKKTTAFADQGGNYKINAEVLDTIVISFVGYEADTFVVRVTNGYYQHDADLEPGERFLHEVEVTDRYNAYQLDSIARRDEFAVFLEQPKRQLTETDTHTGFGIRFSPFTRYSKREKDKRKFKEFYAQNEEVQYTRYRYSPGFVKKVTGLDGDSLTKFMEKYTPSYNELRDMSNETLIFWTSERALKFRGKPVPKGNN